jgi:uncharacterized protein YodC (DUF2158 family)
MYLSCIVTDIIGLPKMIMTDVIAISPLGYRCRWFV